MQSYQSEASGSGVRGTLDPLPASSSSQPDDISKYRTRYEEAMNPFEVFRGRVCVGELPEVDAHGSHVGT